MVLSLDERWVTAEPSPMVEWFVEISRERLATIAGEAERGLQVIEVDGSQDADGFAREIEIELPQGEPARDVAAVRRWENMAAARQIQLWVASGEGPAVAPEFPFACARGRVSCCEVIQLSMPRFDALVESGGNVLGHD